MAWGVPARILADELTAEDVVGYEAWYGLEPYGTVPDDVRTAIIAHTTAASMAKNPPAFAKFVPKWEMPDPLNSQQTYAALDSWAKSQNAKTK